MEFSRPAPVQKRLHMCVLAILVCNREGARERKAEGGGGERERERERDRERDLTC